MLKLGYILKYMIFYIISLLIITIITLKVSIVKTWIMNASPIQITIIFSISIIINSIIFGLCDYAKHHKKNITK